MDYSSPRHPISGQLPLLLGLAAVSSEASSNAGEASNYVAAALMSLGLTAIFVGVRGLKGLRLKQPLPRHRRSAAVSGPTTRLHDRRRGNG
ncbi:MAG: hypothetical protein PVF93_11290 [Chromatiaceae bacterium]|jgi:hypothetical protein